MEKHLVCIEKICPLILTKKEPLKIIIKENSKRGIIKEKFNKRIK